MIMEDRHLDFKMVAIDQLLLSISWTLNELEFILVARPTFSESNPIFSLTSITLDGSNLGLDKISMRVTNHVD